MFVMIHSSVYSKLFIKSQITDMSALLNLCEGINMLE